MKRTFVAIVFAVLSILASAQNPDSRDKSKYAVNNFENDDLYTMYQPYETVSVAASETRKVKNIIFMIGDGMGLEQLSTAWVLNGQHLNITDNCTSVGIQWTYSANRLITDSAAAGTALATGTKTKNGRIAVDPEGKELTSLADVAKAKGKKVGTAVVCRMCDATPAVFFTHAEKRDSLYDIAAQFAESDIDYLFAGGMKWWANRPDGRDLTGYVQDRGYTFVSSREELDAVKDGKMIGVMAYKELPPALDRGDLFQAGVAKALELLDNKNGFFLMVEGSCIDDYCHANKVGYAMEELFDFDRAVGLVLEWAAKDGETLVVVTGDHSTGGMTLLEGNLKKQKVGVNFSSQGHNGVALPVYAWGPGAERFTGIYENTELSNRIRSLIR